LSASVTNEVVEITVTAQPGLAYILQASTDFVAWTPIATNTASPGGTIKFFDSTSPQSARFYRTVRQLP